MKHYLKTALGWLLLFACLAFGFYVLVNITIDNEFNKKAQKLCSPLSFEKYYLKGEQIIIVCCSRHSDHCEENVFKNK